VATECGLDKSIKIAKNSPLSIGILSESIEAYFAMYILNGMEEEMKIFVNDVIDFYFEKEISKMLGMFHEVYIPLLAQSEQ
jgi:hypothetical protein